MNEVVVVTGACGLLGRTFTRSLIENNFIAVLTDNNEESLAQFKKELSKEYPNDRYKSVIMDINSQPSIESALNDIISDYGVVHALVNNAYPRNKNYGRSFEQVEYADFCENINLNLGGYFLVSQKFLTFFLEQDHGKIINIASIYGVIPPRFDIYNDTKMTMPVEYAVIKSALIHLTKYLAKYYKGRNIQINSISPGGIFDNQPDGFVQKYNSQCLNKGILNPSDIVGTLIFLLQTGSEFINGQNIIVDDGFTL